MTSGLSAAVELRRAGTLPARVLGGLHQRRRLIYGLYVSVPLLALVVVNDLAQILA